MMQQLLLQFYTSQNPFSAVSSAAVPGRYWMCCRRHPYQKGIAARKGVEY